MWRDFIAARFASWGPYADKSAEQPKEARDLRAAYDRSSGRNLILVGELDGCRDELARAKSAL